MKRILIFSLAYHPFVGGAELAVREITGRLDPREYSFDMITLRFDRDLPRVENIGNVMVHRIGFSAPGAKISDRSMPLRCKLAKLFFPFTSFFKALSLNRQMHQGGTLPQAREYDLTWALMANQAGFGALFFKLARPRTPYFLELQDGRRLADVKSRRPLLRLAWPLYRLLYLKADRIKAISRFIEREVRRLGCRGPVEIIPNGVDFSEFSRPIPPERLEALKARFGIRPGDVVLFSASRLVPSRGVEDAIRALPHLPPEAKLLIAGDGEDRQALERVAEDAAVAGRVIFAGNADHRDLPAYFNISRIFVRPSLIEGMGSAFIEAFAAGVPVVATPVGGIPEFLKDGETGVFCKARDPESVAAAVRRYLGDPELVARVVGNAKKLAEEKYDWNLIARDMREKILEPLVGR